MAVTYPDPSGGEMTVANEQEARDRGWNESMGTLGAYSQDADFVPGEQGGNQQSTDGQQQNTQQMGAEYGAAIQRLTDALASGNREAFQRAVHEFDVTFQLDKDKFAETIRQYNQNFGLTQSGVTGTYQGAATLPALTSYATQFGQWGVPQTGAQTLAAQLQNATLTGMYGGGPTLAARMQAEAIAAQRAGLTGYYQQPGWVGDLSTEAGRQAARSNGYWVGLNDQGQIVAEPGHPGGQVQAGVPSPGMGMPTMQREQQTYAQQMGAISAAAALQANPFRQSQVIGQLGNVLGGGPVAGFQAPNVVQGVGTAGGNTRGGMGYLAAMIEDIRNPAANEASMNQILNATPTPAKLNSVEFMRASPSTQSLTLQAMQERYGLDPADSLKQIQATMPQFTAPTMGSIKR